MFKMTLETAQTNISLYTNYISREKYQIGVIGDRLVKYHKPDGLFSHIYDRISLIFNRLLAFLSFERWGVSFNEVKVVDKMQESQYVLIFEYSRNNFSPQEIQEILLSYQTDEKETPKSCTTSDHNENMENTIPLELLTNGC